MTKADQAGHEPTALETVTARISDAYETARDKASTVVHSTGGGIEANPIVALLGGLALGAAAGALIPRSEREHELLAPLGERLAEAARAAIAAGREAGRDALQGSGLSAEGLREQVSGLVSQAGKAAASAGTAAFQAAKDSSKG